MPLGKVTFKLRLCEELRNKLSRHRKNMGNNSVHSDEAIESLEKLTKDTSNGA